MKFPVFDFHCDTALALLGEDLNQAGSLRKNTLHIDLERAETLGGYAQCFACFTTPFFEEWYHGEVLKLSEQEIPSLLSDIGAKITTFVDDGDVVIADTAEDLTAGKVVEVQETHGKKVAAGLHTMLCKPIKGCFAPGWLGYYMNSETYHKQLVPYIAGVKVMSISKGNIVKTHILVPPIEEQTAIVKVFSTTDHEIDLFQRDIEQEKQKKKALMRLLLTGIVRVNV